MLIVSCNVSDDKKYTLSLKLDSGIIEKVSFTNDGLYSICYADGKNLITQNGRVLRVNCTGCDRDRYILFDSSEDNMNRRVRIYFDQIKAIKDITPMDSYRIAIQHGFKGSIEEWLESLKGQTPVAGVDYWTEEDKEVLRKDIDAMVKSEIDAMGTDIEEAVKSVEESISTIENIKNEAAELVDKANEKIYEIQDKVEDKVSSSLVERLEGETDEEVIERIMEGKTANPGDRVVIKTFSESELKYIYTPYVYYDEWVPENSGNIDADNIIVKDNLTITGENGETVIINTAGKNVTEVITTVLTKEILPTIEQPEIVLTLLDSGEKEVGSVYTPSYTAELLPGSYSYGPDTDVKAIEWEITDSNGNTSNEPHGSFEPFVIMDHTNYTITAKVTHGMGKVPVTNTKNEYPEGQILSGEKTITSEPVTGFRTFFYGANIEPIELDSENIRADLVNGGRTIPDEFYIDIPEGTTQVVIALFDRSVISVNDTNAFGLDIVSCFAFSEMHIEGMSGYISNLYKIYVYSPATSLGSNKYKVTIE